MLLLRILIYFAMSLHLTIFTRFCRGLYNARNNYQAVVIFAIIKVRVSNNFQGAARAFWPPVFMQRVPVNYHRLRPIFK